MRAFTLLKKAINKPPRVVAYRVMQEFRLEAMRWLNTWQRLEQISDLFWNQTKVREYLELKKNNLTVLADDCVETLRSAVDNNTINGYNLLKVGEFYSEKKFDLLGVPVQRYDRISWHSDWRFDYTWKPRYFRDYNFYEPYKKVPYDVKLPWELSRLGYLQAMLQCAVFDNTEKWTSLCAETMSQWESSNPLAYTVNWYSMEASIRGINLVLLLDMLLGMNKPSIKVVQILLRKIAKHGEFIYRTIEYSDVRGNHYTANIVALLLIGSALNNNYPQARQWYAYATNAVFSEIELQFLEDGVNFEKAISYHGLVLELFLLALLSFKKRGAHLPSTAMERLHSAFKYTAACVRPDGLYPNVGDNDNARLLQFDAANLRDHRPLVGIGAALFRDAYLKSVADTMPVSIIWLLGRDGVQEWNSLPIVPTSGKWLFDKGGVVAAREKDSYFWIDVGEVGLHGRGGHGHNDLFSFELMFDRTPLIIDPGSYVYTGDAKARDLFRSTAYHNAVRIDSREIALMPDMWTIRDEARPYDVEIDFNAGVRIAAKSSAYEKLDSPVGYRREIVLDLGRKSLTCWDSFETQGIHQIERFFHFHPDISVHRNEEEGDRVILSSRSRNDVKWQLTWSGGSESRIEGGWVSHGYGEKVPAPVLTLTDHIRHSMQFSFHISQFSKEMAQ